MMHSPAPKPEPSLTLPPFDTTFLLDLLWSAYQENHADFLAIIPTGEPQSTSIRKPFGFFVVKEGDEYDYRYPREVEIPPSPAYPGKFQNVHGLFGKRARSDEERRRFPDGSLERAAVDTGFAPIAWMNGQEPQLAALSFSVLDRDVFDPNTLRLPWLTRNQITSSWTSIQLTLLERQQEQPGASEGLIILQGLGEGIDAARQADKAGAEPVAWALLTALSSIGVVGVQLFRIKQGSPEMIASVGSLQLEIFNSVPQDLIEQGAADFQSESYIAFDLVPSSNLDANGRAWHSYQHGDSGIAVCLDLETHVPISPIQQIAATCVVERTLWLTDLRLCRLSL